MENIIQIVAEIYFGLPPTEKTRRTIKTSK